MLVSPTGKRPNARLRNTKKPSLGSAGFDALVSGTIGHTANADNAANVASLDSIIALQGVDDALTDRKAVLAQSDALLDALEDLKLAILGGQLADRELRVLQDLAHQRPSDHLPPNLRKTVQEIELRARVELAKRGLSA